MAIGPAKKSARLARVEKSSCPCHLKSHLNTTFLHTSITHINTSHAIDQRILFFDSVTLSSSQDAIIIFIPAKTIIKIAIATIDICKNVRIFHSVLQKTSLFINIFLW